MADDPAGVKDWIEHAEAAHLACRVRHHDFPPDPIFRPPTREDPTVYFYVDICRRCTVERVAGYSMVTHRLVIPSHYPEYPKGYRIVGCGYMDADDIADMRRAYNEQFTTKQRRRVSA